MNLHMQDTMSVTVATAFQSKSVSSRELVSRTMALQAFFPLKTQPFVPLGFGYVLF